MVIFASCVTVSAALTESLNEPAQKHHDSVANGCVCFFRITWFYSYYTVAQGNSLRQSGRHTCLYAHAPAEGDCYRVCVCEHVCGHVLRLCARLALIDISSVRTIALNAN